MKTDRELLESAAKAVGMTGWRYSGDVSGMLQMIDPSRPGCTGSIGPNWNPLIDDGDALRLAVKLCGHGFAMFDLDIPIIQARIDGADMQAATRLAIVKAAAEIGATK